MRLHIGRSEEIMRPILGIFVGFGLLCAMGGDCGGTAEPELTCDTVLCAEGSRCEMLEGKPVCVENEEAPAPTCDDVACGEGERCVLEEVVCVRAPCPAQPVCVRACLSDGDCGEDGFCDLMSYCDPPPACGPEDYCDQVCYGRCAPEAIDNETHDAPAATDG